MISPLGKLSFSSLRGPTEIHGGFTEQSQVNCMLERGTSWAAELRHSYSSPGVSPNQQQTFDLIHSLFLYFYFYNPYWICVYVFVSGSRMTDKLFSILGNSGWEFGFMVWAFGDLCRWMIEI